ncbi:MAG: hypothetical protein HKN13_15455, partial [Rhodothermales bacterium]|nr:hypothetical protein [Rhodothermales bacterium]
QNTDPGSIDDPELDAVISVALEKDRDRRYSSCDDFVADLESATSASAVSRPSPTVAGRKGLAPLYIGLTSLLVLLLVIVSWRLTQTSPSDDIHAVAVLPLINSSGNPDQEFLADGVTSAVINELSKIGTLKVIARQSVMRFKNSQLTLREIADDLGVDAIVSGNVIRAGDRIHISAELVRATSEENIWADSFDERFENVLALHSRLARDIARQINVSQTITDKVFPGSSRTVDPQAYEAYLRGRHHVYMLSQADAEAALEYFRTSLAIDSTFADAHAGVALAFTALNQMNAMDPSKAISEIETALDRAAELDSTLALVYYTRALIDTWGRWDWDSALDNFDRTLDLNPNYGEAHAYFAHLLYILRRGDEGMPHAERSVELDPHNSLFRSLYGDALLFEGDAEAAAEQFRLSQQTAPRSFVNFNGLNWAYAALERFEDANLQRIRKYEAAEDPEMVAALQTGFAAGGYRTASLRAATILAARAESTFVGPIQIQRLYTDAGEAELSLDWLQHGFDAHEPGMPYIGVIPDAAVLRQSERYPNMLRKMKLEMWIE